MLQRMRVFVQQRNAIARSWYQQRKMESKQEITKYEHMCNRKKYRTLPLRRTLPHVTRGALLVK
jgi:hypothetical protein